MNRELRRFCLKYFVIITIVILPLSLYAAQGFTISLQGGAVFTGYNDVALPGDTGTKISFSDELRTDPGFSPRIEAGYEFSFPLYIGLMASTLKLYPEGELDRDVSFDGKSFSAGTDVRAVYRFDSYRATARYYFIDNKTLRIGAGFTAKIRDAEITLKGGGSKGGLTNTGFVPIINFYLRWNMMHPLALLVYGDGAWSPYGRAEDFFAGLVYSFNDRTSVMAGYRILEGGADNDEVYTFSLFNYAVAGVEFNF